MRWSMAVLGAVCLAVAASQGARADTAQYQAAASGDDAYVTSTWSGYNQTTMYFPYTTGDRRAFMRWAIDIPAGATITAATVQVKSNGNAGDANASTIRLQLVDSDSCPSFTTNPFSYDVSTSYVDWELSGTWTSGQWYTSPDVSSLVQAFIDRGGYSTGNYLGLRGVNASGSWKQAYQYDNASTDAAIFNVTYTTNTAPVADAGSDQEVTDSDDSGYETVTLDGSGSSDSDGTISSWIWSEGGSPIATGETASVSLAVGTHTITLTVTDDDSATDSDTVTVTVNEAPEEIEDEFQVAASADDCYTTSTWSAYNQTTMYFPYTTGDRRAFIRWSVDIPTGSTIVSAYLKVKSNGNAGDANASTVRLQLVDADSCPSFSTNPHATAVSTSYVDWSVPGTWTSGQWYTSPDVGDLVQEFIDRAGYSTGNYLGLRGINASGSWKQAYQYDNASADAAILEVTYTTGGGGGNDAPVADAGSDQTVTDSDDSGYETVTLDGSGSSDSDGTITSWVWKEGATQIATGETASVSLSVGTHTVTLTVTDDDSDTDADTVTVTVIGYTNVPPVADAGSDQTVTDSDNSGYETVTLDGSGSSDSDGTITSWIWSEGGSPIATGQTASVSLAAGTHTITLTVTDDDSDTDDDAVSVAVNEPSSEKDLEFQGELTSDDAAATSSDTGATQTTMYWPYTSTDRRSFMRWASYIPPEATITAAYLKVRSNGEAGDANSSVVRIQLVDSDDCPAFTTAANPFNYDVTEDYVDWTVSGTWTAGQWYTSPDISDLVQDFIDRPGYEFGSYIGLRAMFGGSGSWKRAYTWDYGDHTSGPKLEIHYTGGIVLVDLWMADPEVRVAQKVYCQLFNVDDDQTLRAKLDGSTIYTRAEDLEAEEVFVADYRNLEAGEHTLLVQILDESETVLASATRTWTTLHDGVPHVGIDENNSIRVDDELFFPITPFQWDKGNFGDDVCEAFNAMFGEGTYPSHNVGSWKDYIDSSAAEGWMAAGPLQWDGFNSSDPRNSDTDKMVEYVQQTRYYSDALLAWFWDDEPDLGGSSTYNPPSTVRTWTDLCHANDTNHPHWINLVGYNFTHDDAASQNNLAKEYCFLYNGTMFDGVYTPVVDIIGFDYYPYEYCTKWTWCSLSDNMLALDRMNAWNYGLLPITTCIEAQDIHDPDGLTHDPAYGWPIQHDYTPDPTPQMVYNLVWASVIHEVKAINYFPYFCPVPEDNIDVMVDFKDQMAELGPIVLGDPEVTREISETESSGRVDIMTREANGTVYIFAAEIRDLETPKVIEDEGTYTWNLSGGNITVRFDVEDLPDGATVVVYDESRSIEAEEGYFEDTFGPLDVHIYVWNTTDNEPPEADAGSDSLVVDSDENGYETVTLDGSGSSDSDGSIVSYVWKDGTTAISTDQTAQVTLSSKRHIITLVVTDNDGATDSDVRVVTVNTAPTADAGSDDSATDSNGDGYETITLDGSDSEDGDGAIASYVWSEGGSPIATGETVDVALSVGTHTITLTVTDTGGATDSDDVVMAVGTGGSTAAEYQIAASPDDTYCTESASSYTSTTMYVPYTSADRRAFLRWPITVPDGATIIGAYVKIRSNGASGDYGPSTVRLEVVDSDSCGSFTTNPYSSSVMAGYVDWQLPGTWTSGQWFRSSNIATLVQGFIDRGGYASGNYLGLRLEWTAGQWKQAYQYNNAPADGAILKVYYTTP